jgi:hypothetical protein
MVAPGYLAFISKLAPKENISAYIGCNFISYMIGLLGGSIVFGIIVAYVGVDLRMPYFFYGILISFALLLFFAFIIYYRTWGQDVIERAKKIREMEEGVKEDWGASDEYKEPIMFKIFDQKFVTVVPLLLVPVVLFGTFSFGTFNYIGPEEEVEEIPFDINDYIVTEGSSFDFAGDLVQGGSDSEIIIIEVGEGELLDEGELLKSISFLLTWEDEGNEGLLGQHQNPPDEFSITASLDENNTKTDSGSNPQDGEGSLELTFDFTHESAESVIGTGEWMWEVTLENVGDFTSPRFTDNSNSYTLVVTTEIYSPE